MKFKSEYYIECLKNGFGVKPMKDCKKQELIDFLISKGIISEQPTVLEQEQRAKEQNENDHKMTKLALYELAVKNSDYNKPFYKATKNELLEFLRNKQLIEKEDNDTTLSPLTKDDLYKLAVLHGFHKDYSETYRRDILNFLDQNNIPYEKYTLNAYHSRYYAKQILKSRRENEVHIQNEGKRGRPFKYIPE